MSHTMRELVSRIKGVRSVIWDNKMIHRSLIIKDFLAEHNNRLITRRIPAYSPELNPDEYVWNALKYQELPNSCSTNIDELKNKVIITMNKLKSDPAKVRNIIRGSSLPLPQFVGRN